MIEDYKNHMSNPVRASSDDKLSTNKMLERKKKQDAKSDRKRQRERKRRKDVNQGFDRLIELLGKIDTQSSVACEEAEGTESDNVNGAAPCNRVNLISRANIVLARLYDENQLLKEQVQGDVEESEHNSYIAAKSSTAEASALRVAKLYKFFKSK